MLSFVFLSEMFFILKFFDKVTISCPYVHLVWKLVMGKKLVCCGQVGGSGAHKSRKGTFGYILNLYVYFLMQVGFNTQVLSSGGAAFG